MSQKLSPQDRRLLEELVRREERSQKVDFAGLLFGPQKAFIEDPSLRKAAVCTRRAGKTYGLVIYMVKEALKRAFVQIPYITLTRAQGKRNIWLDLQQLNNQLELGMKFNQVELTATLPNGSVIFIQGANDETEIQRLRGGKYPLVVLDECQSFRPFLKRLIDEILAPAVADYRGTICMTGTPGPACAGYYYEMTGGGGEGSGAWSTHHWSVIENPHHPYGEDDIEAIRVANGWRHDNPSLLREWYGQWVHDDSRVVYKFDMGINLAIPPIPEKLSYVLGIDLGYADSTAFVVLGYDESAGRCYVLESKTEEGLIPSAVAVRVQQFRERYDLSHIVADSGGFGKGYVEEMNQRYFLNVKPAEKTQKFAFIELLNGDLQAGALKFIRHKNRDLIDELGTLLWTEDEEGKPDHTEIDPRFPDHLCDALLYGWRACRQYYYDPTLELPRAGSPEASRLMHQKMEDEVRDRVMGDPNQAWWSQGYADDFVDEALGDEEPWSLSPTGSQLPWILED